MKTATRITELHRLSLSTDGGHAQKIAAILCTVSAIGCNHVRVSAEFARIDTLIDYAYSQVDGNRFSANLTRSGNINAAREYSATSRKWQAIAETLKAVKASNAQKWK